MHIIPSLRQYSFKRCGPINFIFMIIGMTFVLIPIQHYHRDSYHKPISFKGKLVVRYPTEFIRSAANMTQVQLQRAIVIYYPHDHQKEHFLSELRWLYRSWIEMMNISEPKSWRTDLVIFTGNFTSHLKQLGCRFDQIRTDTNEPPQCRVFPYVPVSYRNPNINWTHSTNRKRSALLYEHLRTYEYADSINVIAEDYSKFSMYDFILRTDIDVFITQYFGFYVPISNKTLLVGAGGYSTDFNTNRLRRIANNMGWFYANMSNIGSTWYGPPHLAHRIANFTVEAMLYLHINEFSKPESERKLGTMLWPAWHYGVLSLYGAHLAINHLVLSEELDIRIANQLLDQSVTNKDQDDMRKNTRLHLHCWHSVESFSKFALKNGKYDRIDPRSFVNNTSAHGYAMRMALESRWMSLPELSKQLQAIQNDRIIQV